MILTSMTMEGDRMIAEKLRRDIEDLHLPHGSSTVGPYVTVSIGGASTIPHPAGR